MSRKWIGLLVGSLVLAGVLGSSIALGATGSLAAESTPPAPASDGQSRQDAGSDAAAPAISSIDSPSATCDLPTAGTGACYVHWDYLSVSAGTGAYVISMTVAIDGRLRAFSSGFFQTSMFIADGMNPTGFKVSCGAPGSGGNSDPRMGKTYSYVIRARDTAGTTAANYGSVSCPADIVRVLLPLVRRR